MQANHIAQNRVRCVHSIICAPAGNQVYHTGELTDDCEHGVVSIFICRQRPNPVE